MRVKLKPGEQRRFLEEVLSVLRWTQRDLAANCAVSRSRAKDWYHERYNAPYEIFTALSVVAGVPLPKFAEVMSEEEWRSRRSQESYRSRAEAGQSLGTAAGRSRGGATSQQRRKANPELYPGLGAKPIIRAEKSPKLAEFIGIMLGDGGIAEYQVTVTLNLQEEREYAAFVMQLVRELFGLDSTLQERPEKGACVVVISSMELVHYLQELGLVQGNKVELQCGVPEWIFDDIGWMMACTRGMIDSDGCVYHHAYTIKYKEYSYVKMTYAGRSFPMLLGLQRMLQNLGYKPGIVRKPGYLSLSSDPAVRYYHEQQIGSNNPYHWRRYWAAVEETKKRKL